jgi:8-oxo-dGTP diphosphatase
VGVDTDNSVGVILVDREGRFLLQLRDDIEGINWPGMWGIVGGAIEEGEAPYDAAVRETEEEIGRTVRGLDLVGKLPVFRGGGSLYLFCASAAFSDEDIVVGEGQDARFFHAEDVQTLEPTTPYLKPLLTGFLSDPLYKRCMQDAQR